jgi:hypothetical protein
MAALERLPAKVARQVDDAWNYLAGAREGVMHGKRLSYSERLYAIGSAIDALTMSLYEAELSELVTREAVKAES